jgi:hypothetical protein
VTVSALAVLAGQSTAPVPRHPGAAAPWPVAVHRSAEVHALPSLTLPLAVNQTFHCSGQAQQWTVPPGVSQLQVHAVGASGTAPDGGSKGGLGAEIYGGMTVSPGQVLTVRVGCSGGFGGHSGGGSGSGTIDESGGRGGGSSTVSIGASTVVEAGGGGGGGGDAGTRNSPDFTFFPGGDGGSAGGKAQPGQGGASGPAPGPDGGCGGCRSAGNGGSGQNQFEAGGGGGGGGLRGGGGGGGATISQDSGGGGGAGSSYLSPALRNGSLDTARYRGDGQVTLSSGNGAEAFDYSGAPQRFVVPAGVAAIHVHAVGGGGAPGEDAGAGRAGSAGEAGGLDAVLPVDGTFHCSGQPSGEDGAFGQGRGGDGGSHDGLSGRGGGGGGSTAVADGSTVLLVAGGGGGGGGAGAGVGKHTGGNGGSGGLLPTNGGGGSGPGSGRGGKAGTVPTGKPSTRGGHGTDAGDATMSGGGGGGGGGYNGGAKGHGGDIGGGGGGGGGAGRSYVSPRGTQVSQFRASLVAPGQVLITWGVSDMASAALGDLSSAARLPCGVLPRCGAAGLLSRPPTVP